MNVCMVAYSQYFRDARIKRYVGSIEGKGGIIDVLALQEDGTKHHEQIGNCRVFYLTEKYQGSNRLLYVWSYLNFFLKAFFKLTSLYMKNRYSAVHVHNMPNFIVFAAIVPRLLGAKVILDVHDLMTANYIAKFTGSKPSLMVQCLMFEQKIAAMFASHVLCADHMQKAYLENECNVPKEKLTAVLNLPDERIFCRREPTHSSNIFRLIYHGTIAKRLGIDIMLEAVSKIKKEIPVQLSIYGSGDYLPEALRLAEKLNLGESAYFNKAFFPVEKVPEMVSGMDIGIIANRKTLATDRFMLPVKLLEYVYLGIPVVAPRLRNIQSYFDEDMIEYYDPENVDALAECIVRLYREPKRRESLIKQSARFYDKHSWKIQGKEYLTLISGETRTNVCS